jgi:hypothetical protein
MSLVPLGSRPAYRQTRDSAGVMLLLFASRKLDLSEPLKGSDHGAVTVESLDAVEVTSHPRDRDARSGRPLHPAGLLGVRSLS